MSLFTVGLTGGIGSGKSAVAEHFATLGVPVIDSDVAAREVVVPGSPALRQLAEHFGAELLRADGTLDRPQLRTRVFAKAADRHWLEQLLHPLIRERCQQQLDAAIGPYALFVVPLLVEAGSALVVDRVLVVDLPEALQLRRTARRDRADEASVRAIMTQQANRAQRRARARRSDRQQWLARSAGRRRSDATPTLSGTGRRRHGKTSCRLILPRPDLSCGIRN